MTLLELMTPTYVQMLRGLSAWLAKAQEQLPADQAEALLSARLAPDMFPLSTQIRFACTQALEGVGRLQGEPFSPLVDQLYSEGRSGGDKAGSIADAAARIADSIAYVEQAAAQGAGLAEDAAIAHDLPMGLIFDMHAQQFARDWSMPQFYFHVTTAYAILRNQGVDLGKADYIGHMFAHLRPGTQPAA